MMLSLSSVSAFAIETASQLIGQCAAVVNKAPALSIKAIISTSSGNFAVDMTVAKEKFVLDYSLMKVWYDGTTQWTYLKENKELDITDPTDEELLQSNPFTILNFYKNAYNARRLSSTEQIIELTAKDADAAVRKAVVTINPKTHYPEKINVTLSSGHTMTITIGTIKSIKTPAASTFVYSKHQYPASEIVDLR